MKVRLAQMFDTYGAYDLTKAAVFLKRVGDNPAESMDLSSGDFTFDASNFTTIDQGDNKLIFEDEINDFTGGGYVICKDYSGTTYPFMRFPIITDTPDAYTFYLRMQSSTGTIRASLLIDDVDVATIDTTGTADTWEWYSATIGIPDVQKHNFGVRLEETTLALDKIHVNSGSTTVLDTGPAFDNSPYITVHMRVYNTSGNLPSTPLPVYAYKNSLDEVKNDDWYNFALDPIDSSVMINYNGTYALVMSTSGSYNENYIVWELVNNDEYLSFPSALQYRE